MANQGRQGSGLGDYPTGVALLFRQEPFYGILDEFMGVFQIEFDLNCGVVGFDGFDADVQRVGNFLGSISLANQL